MAHPRAIPGLSFELLRAEAEPSPLRTDVAALIGRTARGPVGVLGRVEGFLDFQRRYGHAFSRVHAAPDEPRIAGPLCARGYFENGGQVLHVLRVAGEGTKEASCAWELGAVAAVGGFGASRYVITASSPGDWANGCRVDIRFLATGRPGAARARVDMTVRCEGEPVEVLGPLDPSRIVDEVAERSRLIRLVPDGAAPAPGPGPRHHRFGELVLGGGSEVAPSAADYERALSLVMEADEPAIVIAPDARSDLHAEAAAFFDDAASRAHARLDRMVIADLPDDPDPEAVVAAAAELRGFGAAAAAYAPQVAVLDPEARPGAPLCVVPASGHVAGVYSRLDRERGAHHTPANAPLWGVYDLARDHREPEQAILVRGQVNLLRCRKGHGVFVWGGRTLADPLAQPERVFVSHRRLIHRLVRAMRRVAEPLVFENQGPQLWLTLVRALTTVLLEAYQAGALQGSRPSQAFEVACDEKTNPPEAIDEGRCTCVVRIAPAAPMEFIELIVTVRRDGTLEVA